MPSGWPCLVVGGGPVAARKVRGLIACDARVTVVSPEVVAEISALAQVKVEARPYQRGEVANYRLVFAATGDRQTNHQVFEDGQKCGVLVNTADDPHACSFMLPSVVRSEPVTVAVSTSGASPAMAVWIARKISEFLGPEHGEVAMLLSQARAELHRQGRSSEEVKWGELLDGGLVEMVREGRSDEARRLVAGFAGVSLE